MDPSRMRHDAIEIERISSGGSSPFPELSFFLDPDETPSTGGLSDQRILPLQ